jgi:phytoene dehydrogenase-like protein
VSAVRRFKSRGSSGKLNIALDALPAFPGVPAEHPCLGREMHVVDSIERLERAYDDWKAGCWSRDPFLDCMIPSLVDPTMAPPGKHMMSVFVQYAPARLAQGAWDAAARAAFGRTVLAQIERHSPGFEALVRHVEIRTPADLEAEVGLSEGNIFQGELTLDQLFFNRPVPGWGRYRMPIRGLYLCGSSTHPGGGVMGAPGANAAREVLTDLRAPRATRVLRSGAAQAWASDPMR